MAGSCAHAVELGLPSIAFTEHVDFTGWLIAPEVTTEEASFDPAFVGRDGRFRPPPLDSAGYLACVQRCREQFPDLRIVSGAELGEPHWHEPQVKAVLSTGSSTGCWARCTRWHLTSPGCWTSTSTSASAPMN